MSTLEAACRRLSIGFSSGDSPWQLAERIVENWNGSKFLEEEAAYVLSFIIVYVIFPDFETTTRVVGQAEGLLEEVSDLLVGHDPHMDCVAVMLAEQESRNVTQPRLLQ